MRPQSFPALHPLCVWVAVVIAPAAAVAQMSGQQLSNESNGAVAMSAPEPAAPGDATIPPRVSAPAPAPVLTTNDKVQLALGNYQYLLEQNRSKGNREGEAEELVSMASAYRAIHQEQKAVDLFQSAIHIFHDVGNRDYEATAIAHVGDVYREWGFPDTAVRYYRKALDLYTAASDKNGQAAALNNIGAAWLNLGNQGKCFESLRQARAIFQSNNDVRGEALALSNLGTAYLYFSEDPEKALIPLQEAAAKMRSPDAGADEANALEMIGLAWLKAHQGTNAGLNFERARSLYHALGDAQGEARVAGHLASLAEPDRAGADRGRAAKERMKVFSFVSPAPLVLTAARLRVIETQMP